MICKCFQTGFTHPFAQSILHRNPLPVKHTDEILRRLQRYPQKYDTDLIQLILFLFISGLISIDSDSLILRDLLSTLLFPYFWLLVSIYACILCTFNLMRNTHILQSFWFQVGIRKLGSDGLIRSLKNPSCQRLVHSRSNDLTAGVVLLI